MHLITDEKSLTVCCGRYPQGLANARFTLALNSCDCPWLEINGVGVPGWSIEFFASDADNPDWKTVHTYFRNMYAASLWVEKNNAELLDAKRHRMLQQWNVHQHKLEEDRVLREAGMRTGTRGAYDPGPYVEIADLGDWDSRYRAVPMQFEDDPK